MGDVLENREKKRMAAIFEGKESSLDDEICAGQRKAEGQCGQWSGHENGFVHRDRRQKRLGDGNGHDCKERGEETHDDGDVAQGFAQL